MKKFNCLTCNCRLFDVRPVREGYAYGECPECGAVKLGRDWNFNPTNEGKIE